MKTYSIFALMLASLCLATGCSEKEGCTDSIAANYDPDAGKDNGSCTYELTNDLLNSTPEVWAANISGLHLGNPDVATPGDSTNIRDVTGNKALAGFDFNNVKPGTVLIRNVYANDNGQKGALKGRTFMFKREAGYYPDGGDWEYVRIPYNAAIDYTKYPNGDLAFATERGQITSCAGCHLSAQHSFIFTLDNQ